jgi:hypothetical protein
LPVFLLNSKGDIEFALKQREGSALMYRYLSLFSIPVIPILKSFIADYGNAKVRKTYKRDQMV